MSEPRLAIQPYVVRYPVEQYRDSDMKEIKIRFQERETMPDKLEKRAKELDITIEQLVKRFICAGMEDYETDDGPAKPGESLDDFFVQNGVLKPK
ncbi:hypothetical protein DET61_11688 [Marinobacter nauticus]|uniref:Uncharacterized protein n=1 Tax=Marinobacter nauticus TaxID=2743 RepID=A0A368XC67_MARNT|nr:hypothetical protein [Marinobacter nauticus]RCW64047.1 hypothetical protein DET61_11688 [Marinobacter nauticus]